jgi:hypothetical protein
METIYTILGLAMFYSWGHFAFIQHSKTYKDRTTYEKVITWFAFATFGLYLLGSL